jgi:hypothetical protein
MSSITAFRHHPSRHRIPAGTPDMAGDKISDGFVRQHYRNLPSADRLRKRDKYDSLWDRVTAAKRNQR